MINKIQKFLYFLVLLTLFFAFLLSFLFFGGWWYPIFWIPSVFLLGIASLLAGGIVLLSFIKFKTGNVGGQVPMTFYINPWCFGFFVFVCVYLVWRVAASGNFKVGFESLSFIYSFASVYFLFIFFIRRGYAVVSFIYGLFCLGLIQMLVVLIQFNSSFAIHPLYEWASWFRLPDGESNLNLGHVTGTFAFKGTLGGFLAVMAIFAFSLAFWARNPPIIKILLFWLSFVFSLGVVMSLSRAAYLSLFFAFCSVFLISCFIVYRYSTHRLRSYVMFTLSIGLFSSCLHFFYADSYVLSARINGLLEDPYRDHLWFELIPQMLNLDPWFGLGSGSFDFLSLRYRTSSLGLRPLYAHNDWLQLLIEYGRVGLVVVAGVFFVHLIYGLRTILYLACKAFHLSFMIPQSTRLALLVASVSSLLGLGVLSFFDYQMQLFAIIVLVAMCGGIISGSSCFDSLQSFKPFESFESFVTFEHGFNRVRLHNFLSSILLVVIFLFVGALLSIWSIKNFLPQYYVLKSENALVSGDFKGSFDYAQVGLLKSPEEYRLLMLSAESAGQWGNSYGNTIAGMCWYKLSAGYWFKVVNQTPRFAYAVREAGLSLDWIGQQSKALPLHLRAIALDPNFARGYEYLGIHYWSLKEYDKAVSLMLLGQKLIGNDLSNTYLPLLLKEREEEGKLNK